jgi:hypothetical protein
MLDIQYQIDAGAATSVIVYIASDSSIQDALNTITRAITRKSHLPAAVVIGWDYMTDYTAAIAMNQGHNLTFTQVNEDFYRLLNIEPDRRNGYLNNAQRRFEFPNVWNRTGLYIHASFVNNIDGGYLSHGDEFYTSPSKQYKVEYPISTFFFETSFDGYHKVPLPYENFIVELSFLIDVEDYY